MIKHDGEVETDYMLQWGKRSANVDCRGCNGDEAGNPGVFACCECEKTGLDCIPWSELFRVGRELFSGWTRK